MPFLNWIRNEKIVNHDKDVSFQLLRKNINYSTYYLSYSFWSTRLPHVIPLPEFFRACRDGREIFSAHSGWRPCRLFFAAGYEDGSGGFSVRRFLLRSRHNWTLWSRMFSAKRFWFFSVGRELLSVLLLNDFEVGPSLIEHDLKDCDFAGWAARPILLQHSSYFFYFALLRWCHDRFSDLSHISFPPYGNCTTSGLPACWILYSIF